ncbi:MAG TPA: hypothetical protein VHD83_01800 [Puia sp.]|nr:hypothetical protein [Puia sp.]
MNRNLYQNLLLAAGIIIACSSGAGLQAQPKAYESQTNYQKGMLSAIFVDLPYPPDVVEATIKDYMAQRGWKGSSSRGYKMYHNVRLEDTASSLNDLHIKVERKSSRDKMNSIVTFLPAAPGEDPGGRAGRDALAMSRTTAFVEKMLPAIEAGDLEDRIKTQEGVAKKEQNKLGNLHDDETDLEKKIRNTQDDLAKNKEDQLKETQTLQANVHSDDNAMKKSNKRMSKLLDEQTSLQKKLVKYQAALEQNKKDQESQRVMAGREQQSLDSLRTLRKQ